MKKSLTLGLILLAGALLRAGYLLAPHLDSDQATFGLTAMHVLKGEFPIFQWGYHYLGTLQTYLAALFFAIFGVSREALNAVPLFLSLFFIWITFLLGKELFDEKTGLWAALYAALAPQLLTFHGAWARHGYIETLIFGSLLLLFTAKLIYRDNLEPARKSRLFIAWGFVAGVAWWTNYLILDYLLPCGLLLLWHDKKLPLRKDFWKMAAAFFVGSLPFWIYNFTHGFVSFHMFKSRPHENHFWENLWELISDKLPELIGARDTQTAVGGWLACGVALFVLILLLTRRQPRSFTLPVLFTVILLGLYLSSHYSSGTSIRYLLPLYSVIPLFFARAIATLFEKQRFAGIVLATAVFTINLWDNALSSPLTNPDRIQRYRGDRAMKQKMVEELLQEKITGAYCNEYWVGPLNTFDVQEKIIFAHPFLDRYPLYSRQVHGLWFPAFATVGGSPDLETSLKAMNVRFLKNGIPPFIFYDSFTRVGVEGEIIPAQGWKVTASENDENAGRAVDRNLRTAWRTAGVQVAGMSYQIELPQPEPICQMEFYLGTANKGFPDELLIELSADGVEWKKLQHTPKQWGYFWSGAHPFYFGNFGPMQVSFAPFTARFVRLTVAKPSKKRPYWGFAEIVLYRSLGKRFQQVSPKPVARLVEALDEMPRRKIFTDVWLSAHLRENFPSLDVVDVWRTPVFKEDLDRLRVDFRQPVCFVATEENRGEIARTLEEHSLKSRQVGLKHYTLFLVEPSTTADHHWIWNGKLLMRWKRTDKP